MCKKRLSIGLLCFFVLMAIPQAALAATITSCTPNKQAYEPGEQGYIAVTIYNDKDDTIRVTELSATIDYYYDNGVVYLQKFFTSADLPVEITEGQTATYYITISLPNDVAPGFTEPTVEARTELWSAMRDDWISSDHPVYQAKLYIESPFKQLYEDTEKEYAEQLNVNGHLTNMMNLFIVTTIVFAAVAGFFFLYFSRRTIPIPPQ